MARDGSQTIWIGALASKASAAGLQRAIRTAHERLDAVERGGGDDQTRLTKEELYVHFHADPDLRVGRERTAFARAVGDAVVRYRIEGKLSQRGLAARLGMKPSAVARLKNGDHNPSNETLERLAAGLGMRFLVDVARSDAARAPQADGVGVMHEHATSAGGWTLVAAGPAPRRLG